MTGASDFHPDLNFLSARTRTSCLAAGWIGAGLNPLCPAPKATAAYICWQQVQQGQITSRLHLPAQPLASVCAAS